MKGCPIYQLYMESGNFPERFHIKWMKSVFYQYILSQKDKSMFFSFLMAHKKQPRKGDAKHIKITLNECHWRRHQNIPNKY